MPLRVAVIGAGMAGLCALRHLSHDPDNFAPVAFERSKNIGGLWVYRKLMEESDDEYDNGSLHKTLRTNLPKEIMGFADFDFPNYEESFLHHSSVRTYLEDYAEHYDLIKLIKSQVKSVVPIFDVNSTIGRNDSENTTDDTTETVTTASVCAGETNQNDQCVWKVTVLDVETQQCFTFDFDAIFICSGVNNIPHVPQLPGHSQFRGSILHSKHYRDPADYRQKTVVILGAALSGKDLLMDIAPLAKKIYISHGLESKLAFKLPTNAEEMPVITRILPEGVQFIDGDYREVDVIIFATGYKYDYQFVTDACRIRVNNKSIQPLYRHIFNAHIPTMCFIGLTSPVIQFKLTDAQVQYACAVLRGDVSLPPEEDMLIEEEADNLRHGGLPTVKSKIHTLIGEEQWNYVDTLSREAGFKGVPVSNKTLFKYVDHLFEFGFDNLKEMQFHLNDDKEFIVNNHSQ